MRIRTIKPEFWSNEDLGLLDDFTQLLALGLLNYADDEGYFNANPKLIASAIFPLRDVSGIIPVAVTKLSNLGYLRLFDGEGGRLYGLIVNFKKHQVINKAKSSKIKGLCKQQSAELHFPVALPDEYRQEQGTGNREQGTGNREQGTGNRDMGAGKPAQRATKSASPSRPSDLDEALDFFAEQGAGADQAATFFDHFTANGWKQGGKAVIRDWRAAARNWIRRSGTASRGAAAGLSGGNTGRKNNFGAAGGAARTEEFIKLPIVGIDVGADEVAALEAGKGGAA